MAKKRKKAKKVVKKKATKKKAVKPVKKKGGRPSSYKSEYAQKLIAFFDIEPFEDVELPHYYNDKEARIKWKDFKRVANQVPTLRNFAKEIKVPISTVYDWLNEKHQSYQKEFSGAFTCAKEIRKDFLIQNALQGLYPPLTFKFVATNLTDMTDKTDVEFGKLAIFVNEKFKGKHGNKD